MALDDKPEQPQGAPVSTTEATNADMLNRVMGGVLDALASNSSAMVAKLNAIASAITSSIIGGTTGSVDNRALRSKGTGGRALDASPIAIDDSSNVTPSTAAMALRTNTSLTNTLLLQAYDVDGAAYVTVATATAANTPTFDLLAGTTKGGVAIAVVNQIVQLPTLWLFPEDGTFKIVVKSAFAFTITETTTITGAGTSTVTISINGTPLGGTANSASTSEQSQAHSSANAVAAGDDISITFASTSSDCVNLSLNIAGTIVLAAT
jgi:hypothetical protein